LCFARPEVFATFRLMVAGWVVCLGRRSISRVWETTGRSDKEDHSKAFRLFYQAVWNFDELGRILLVRLLTVFVPGTRVWLVLDDTLCHKRGAKVAFGGIFLDAVLSSKKHKTFRFGTNWVTLGLVIQLPMRQDRFLCVNILWRLYAKKKGKNDKDHRTKSQLAREMLDLVAEWLPDRQVTAVADSAYIGKYLLKGLPAHVTVIGPICWKAALTKPLAKDAKKNRKIGVPTKNPEQIYDDATVAWEPLTLCHPKGAKDLLVKRVEAVCWYSVAGQRQVQVVLVRDPEGEWRDEALVCTDCTLPAHEVVLGYCRRWSVEVAYCDSKQLLGLHDPLVWTDKSVSRAHPMAWFVATVVVLWYCTPEHGSWEAAERQRPWYKDKVRPTFADMLAAARLHLWRGWLQENNAPIEEKLEWLLEYVATAA
jgi:hypothetical protein